MEPIRPVVRLASSLTPSSSPLRRLIGVAAVIMGTALVGACGSGGSDTPVTPVGPSTPITEAAADCSNVELLAKPIVASLQESVGVLTGQPLAKSTSGLASLAGEPGVVPKSTVPGSTVGATVLNVGLTRDDPVLAEALAGRLRDLLAGLFVPAVPEIARVRCEPGRTLDGRTAACYDLRLHVPDIADSRLTQMRELSRCNWASARLQADPALGPSVTYAESRGFASATDATLLLTLRSVLDEPFPIVSVFDPKRAPSRAGASSRPVTKDIVTITSLAWSKSRVTGTLPYSNAVFAPGYSGASGASGTWVMVGLGATIKSYSTKCLQAQFRNLSTSETRLVSSGPACTGDIAANTYKVTLDGDKVAVGYALSQSSGSLTGIALAWGTPNFTVDTLAPDYLVNVSPANVVVSGSVGNGRPDFTTLSESATVEVLLGVGVNAAPAPAPGLPATFSKSEWWGTLASPDPLPSATWNGYTVAQLQSSVITGLNQQYDAAIPSLTYQVFIGCDASIPDMRFCGNLVSSANYSYTLGGPDSGGTCQSACSYTHQQCLAYCSRDCLNGCALRLTACGAKCSTGIDFTGTATVDIRQVRGLELLDFSTASLPPLTQESQIAVDIAGTLPTGLLAGTAWTVCLDTRNGCTGAPGSVAQIPSGPVGITARGTLTAQTCAVGPAALYLTINEILVTQPGVWSLEPLISSVQGVASGAFDGLASNMAQLFDASLKGPVDAATASALAAIRDAMNGVLNTTPLVPCAN